MTKGKAKAIAGRAALVLGSLIFLFAAGEVALRVLYTADRQRGGNLRDKLERTRTATLDEEKGDFNMSALVRPSVYADVVFELKPFLEGEFRGRPIRTNSYGMRDKEYERRKPDNTYRIVGLGDSVMFGWGVGQEDPFLTVLEGELNRLTTDDRAFEVLNFGVPGYNTAMEVAQLEHRGLTFDPDLVIMLFVNNDWGVPMFMQKPREVRTLERLYFLDFLRARVGLLRETGLGNLAGYQLKGMGADESKDVLEQYSHMVNEDGYRRAMARLAELTRARGIRVMVISGAASAGQLAVVDQVAAEHGFHVFNVKPYSDAYIQRNGIENTPKARRRALWVGGGDHHPNAQAHTIFVEAILDHMSRMEIIRLPAGS